MTWLTAEEYLLMLQNTPDVPQNTYAGLKFVY